MVASKCFRVIWHSLFPLFVHPPCHAALLLIFLTHSSSINITKANFNSTHVPIISRYAFARELKLRGLSRPCLLSLHFSWQLISKTFFYLSSTGIFTCDCHLNGSHLSRACCSPFLPWPQDSVRDVLPGIQNPSCPNPQMCLLQFVTRGLAFTSCIFYSFLISLAQYVQSEFLQLSTVAAPKGITTSFARLNHY